MKQTVLFFREIDGTECFYPADMYLDAKPLLDVVMDNVRLNPGTIRVEDMVGNIIWQERDRQ